MKLFLATPLKYHTATLVVPYIAVVMWKAVANVGDVTLVLALVKVPTIDVLNICEVIMLYLSMVRHLNARIHKEVRQFKVTKAVFGVNTLNLLVLIFNKPRHNSNIVLLKELIYDCYARNVLCPLGGLNVTLFTIVKIVVAWDKEHVERF